MYKRQQLCFYTTHRLKEKVDKSNMLFCMADASHPVKYISCGNLLSTDGFLHDRRRMDCFVFIIVTQGTLHLHQEGHNLDIGENQSVLLLDVYKRQVHNSLFNAYTVFMKPFCLGLLIITNIFRTDSQDYLFPLIAAF